MTAAGRLGVPHSAPLLPPGAGPRSLSSALDEGDRRTGTTPGTATGPRPWWAHREPSSARKRHHGAPRVSTAHVRPVYSHGLVAVRGAVATCHVHAERSRRRLAPSQSAPCGSPEQTNANAPPAMAGGRAEAGPGRPFDLGAPGR